MPWQENVCSLHEEQHHSVTIWVKLLFISKVVLSQTHSSHTYIQIHTASRLSCDPLLPLSSSRYMTIRLFRRGDPQSQRITFKTKGLCGEREAGRKRPLKHTHTYAINNTSTYSEWLSYVTLALITVQYVQYRGLRKYFDI